MEDLDTKEEEDDNGEKHKDQAHDGRRDGFLAGLQALRIAGRGGDGEGPKKHEEGGQAATKRKSNRDEAVDEAVLGGGEAANGGPGTEDLIVT